MAYATFQDFDRFLEGFGTNYFGGTVGTVGSITIYLGSWQDAIDYSFARMNDRLQTLERVPIVPVGTNRWGSYHPSLIEWNCVDVIWRKLYSRHITEFQGHLPDWMMQFGSRAMEIFNDLLCDRIALDTDTTTKGIGFPTVQTQTGIATFYTNWDSGFYRDSSYPVTYLFQIYATSNGNGIGQAQYQVSNDNGYSWLPQAGQLVGTDWQDVNSLGWGNSVGFDLNTVKSGLKIRWSPTTPTGSMTGTGTNQFNIGDTWSVHCIPMNVLRVNSGAKVKNFERG